MDRLGHPGVQLLGEVVITASLFRCRRCECEFLVSHSETAIEAEVMSITSISHRCGESGTDDIPMGFAELIGYNLAGDDEEGRTVG